MMAATLPFLDRKGKLGEDIDGAEALAEALHLDHAMALARAELEALGQRDSG